MRSPETAFEGGMYTIAEEQENGNIGNRFVVGPIWKTKIIEAASEMPGQLTTIDFGGRSGSAEVDLLLRDISEIPGLEEIADKVDSFRKRVVAAHVLDIDDHSLQMGQERLQRLESFHPHAQDLIKLTKLNVGNTRFDLDDNSADIALSRHFLMYPSKEELEFHLNEVHRLLKENGQYVFALLNPQYEIMKWRKHYPNHPHPEDHDPIDFPHHGTNGDSKEFMLPHHYRRLVTHMKMMQAVGLEPTSLQKAMPITDAFKEKYPRYYDERCPMAIVGTAKKER